MSLEQSLKSEPWKFDFFQAVRLLECADPRKPRVGRALKATEEPVRLAQEPSLAFAPATVAAYKSADAASPARLSVFFLGLFGPHGPLPLHLTEYARDRMRNQGDATFSRFVDIFHHRMLSLFYRAWGNAQPTVQFDRPREDRYATYIGALFGFGMASFRDRDAFPDLAKLHYAGRFAIPGRPREGLKAILADFFGIPADIEECVGHWLDLPPDSWMKLGDSAATGALGVTATVGTRVWDRQMKFRIVMGPMSYADYQRFLPGGESLRRLAGVVLNYTGKELLWDARFILRKEEVPGIRLGRDGLLGWTSWALSRPAERDADELLLQPVA